MEGNSSLEPNSTNNCASAKDADSCGKEFNTTTETVNAESFPFMYGTPEDLFSTQVQYGDNTQHSRSMQNEQQWSTWNNYDNLTNVYTNHGIQHAQQDPISPQVFAPLGNPGSIGYTGPYCTGTAVAEQGVMGYTETFGRPTGTYFAGQGTLSSDSGGYSAGQHVWEPSVQENAMPPHTPPLMDALKNMDMSRPTSANTFSADSSKNSKKAGQCCPLPDCNGTTQRAAKHLQQFHKMSSNAAKLVINLLTAYNRHKVRKRLTSRDKPDAYKECPVCGIFTTRVDKHMLSHTLDVRPKETEQPGQPVNTVKSAIKHSSCTTQVKDESFFLEVEKSEQEGEEANILLPHNGENETTENKDDISSSDPKISQAVKALLEEFKQWQPSLAGGKLHKGTAKSYSGDCCKVIEYLGGTIESIREYRRLGLPGGLMETMMAKGKEPTTIRNMILAMAKLMLFIEEERHDVLSAEEANTAQKVLRNYKSSLRKEIALQRNRMKRKSQEEVEFLLPQMAQYEGTKHYKEAKLIIGKAQKGVQLNLHEFQHVKDYLITRLLIISGHRSGVIINSTISEYKHAKASTNSYIITVENHKTGPTGAARLTVLPDMWPELKLYVLIRLERIENDKFLFPTQTGKKMQASSVARSLVNALRMKACSNLIRKATVVLHNETDATREQMSDLATHMCHTEPTQKAYYDVSRKEKVAERVSNDIVSRLNKYKTMIKNKPSSKTNAIDEDLSPSTGTAMDEFVSDDTIPNISNATCIENDLHDFAKHDGGIMSETDIPTSTTNPKDTSTSTNTSKPKDENQHLMIDEKTLKHGRRAGFTKEHCTLLKSWFPESNIPTEREMEMILTTSQGFAEQMEGFKPKQLVDKVRSLYRTKK